MTSVSLQDYEEDFEEFEEDKGGEKEEEEEGEMRETGEKEAEREMSPRSRRELEEIQRAMEKENELVRATHSTPASQEAELSHRGGVAQIN